MSVYYFLKKECIKKNALDKQLDKKLEWANLTYRCVHSEFSQPSPKVKKERCTSTKRFGCDFRIYITYNLRMEKFIIYDLKLNHNHEISPEIFYLIYPKQRRLDPESELQMMEDSKMMPNPRLLVKKYKEKTGKEILMKDYHNMKFKMTTKNSDVVLKVREIVKEFSEKEGNLIRIITDPETNILNCLFMQSKYGRSMYSKMPEIVQMDGTYNTNISNYSLYLLVAADLSFKTRIVAAALLRKEDHLSIGTFLEIFKEANPSSSQLKTIVVDKDLAEIKAIKNQFPDVKIILCYWHNICNIEENAKEPPVRKAQISNKFKAMSKTTSQDEFKKLCNEMKEISSDTFWAYFTKNWLPYTNYWAGYSVNFENCYGNNSNARTEGKNHALKLILSRYDKLDTFLAKFIIFLDQDEVESKHRVLYEQFSVKTQLNDNELLQFIQSKYCHELYLKCLEESKKLSLSFMKNLEGLFQFDDDGQTNHTFDPKMQICSCLFFKSYGLPCRHIFQLKSKNLVEFDNFNGSFLLDTDRAIQMKTMKKLKINHQ